jgi:lipopolysaccharide transport system ATP-binding protein
MSSETTRLPTSEADVLVRVEGVSKKFCRSLKKSLLYGVSDIVSDLNPFGGKKPAPISVLRPAISDLRSLPSDLRPDEFWAVNDVSFELKRGECLGLIGRNGAGKTTLLKMLNGLIKPDKGRIEMRGRVGALIALGAGFNPILTGRENIYVNGSVLGLTKREINDKIEDIIDFADIREFIDSPVQSYSSGMNVRLGFAVATALEPDVLILDEVLAVGDVNFRTKCFVRISSLLGNAAVIFVSHSEELLSRICTSGILLEHGKVTYVGELRNCLEVYREKQPANSANLVTYHDAAVQRAELKLHVNEHVSGEDLPLEIHYEVDRPIQLSLHVLSLVDETGTAVAVCDLLPLFKDIVGGTSLQRYSIKALSLRPGIYTVGLEALSVNHGSIMVRKRFPHRLRVKDSISHWSSYTPKIVERNLPK